MVHTTIEEILRRLALQDEAVIQAVLAMPPGTPEGSWLDRKTQTLVRLGALIALDAPAISYQSMVIEALTTGAAVEEIIGTLVAVAPLVGLPRIASATSDLALAMGYDVDAAFERHDGTGNGSN